MTPRWSPDSTQLAYHDQRGAWIIPVDGSQAPRLVAQNVPFGENSQPGEARSYYDPQWHPDGTRLLVVIGLWESSAFGVIDLSTDSLIEMFGVVSSNGTWTNDGRILAWSWYYGYSMPGLFLLDPAQPDAEPVTLLDGEAVWDVVRGPENSWVAIVSPGIQLGPSLLTVWQAPALDGIFAPVFDRSAGGFAESAYLATDGSRFMIAGLHFATQTEYENNSGEIRLIDVSHNTTLRLAEPAPAHTLQWGP